MEFHRPVTDSGNLKPTIFTLCPELNWGHKLNKPKSTFGSKQLNRKEASTCMGRMLVEFQRKKMMRMMKFCKSPDPNRLAKLPQLTHNANHKFKDSRLGRCLHWVLEA